GSTLYESGSTMTVNRCRQDARVVRPLGIACALFLMQPGNPFHMPLAPAAQRLQRCVERGAKFSHRIFHMRWHLVKDLPVNDSIPFHFAKCLNKHLFADTRHEALEFAKTTCPGVHLPQD